MSIGLNNLIWRVFVMIMNLTNKKSKKLIFFYSILMNINCEHKLLLNKITYFDDIIIRFDHVDYRGKHVL